MKLRSYLLFEAGPAVIVETDLSPAERAEWKAITDDYGAQAAPDEHEDAGGQPNTAAAVRSSPSLPHEVPTDSRAVVKIPTIGRILAPIAFPA